jgi:acetyltransferase-like isoleucine patch superfamily enzyme
MLNNVIYYLIRFISRLEPSAIYKSNIDKSAKIGSGSQVVNSEVRRYSYTGKKCTLINVDMGSFCCIADNVVIGGLSHHIDHVSMSPIFHNGHNIFGKNFSDFPAPISKKTFIGNDVWIGSRALIKEGVKIGDGSIIGMGSVVTSDVPAFTIFAGCPARLIRNRFPVEVAERLLASKWWLLNEKKLKSSCKLFSNPKLYLSFINKE